MKEDRPVSNRELSLLGPSDRLWNLVAFDETKWEPSLQAGLAICTNEAHSSSHFEELDTILLLAVNLGGRVGAKPWNLESERAEYHLCDSVT